MPSFRAPGEMDESIHSPVASQIFCSYLSELQEDKRHVDVALHISGCVYYVHKVVLDQSEYFRELILTDGRDKGLGSSKTGPNPPEPLYENPALYNPPVPGVERSPKRTRLNEEVDDDKNLDGAEGESESEPSVDEELDSILSGLQVVQWHEEGMIHIKLTPCSRGSTFVASDNDDTTENEYVTLAANIAKKHGEVTTTGLKKFVDSLYCRPLELDDSILPECLATALYLYHRPFIDDCVQYIFDSLTGENCMEWLMFTTAFDLADSSADIATACLGILRKEPSLKKLRNIGIPMSFSLIGSDNFWVRDEAQRVELLEELLQAYRSTIKSLFEEFEVGDPRMFACIDLLFARTAGIGTPIPVARTIDALATFEMQQSHGWVMPYNESLETRLSEYISGFRETRHTANNPTIRYQEVVRLFLNEVHGSEEITPDVATLVEEIAEAQCLSVRDPGNVATRKISRERICTRQNGCQSMSTNPNPNIYVDTMPLPPTQSDSEKWPQEWWESENFAQLVHIPDFEDTSGAHKETAPIVFSQKRCLKCLLDVTVEILPLILWENLSADQLQTASVGRLLNPESLRRIQSKKSDIRKKLEFAAQKGVETYEELNQNAGTPQEIKDTKISYCRFGVEINGLFCGTENHNFPEYMTHKLSSFNQYLGAVWCLELTRRLDEEDGESLSLHLRRKSASVSCGEDGEYIEKREKIKFKFGIRAMTGAGCPCNESIYGRSNNGRIFTPETSKWGWQSICEIKKLREKKFWYDGDKLRFVVTLEPM